MNHPCGNDAMCAGRLGRIPGLPQNWHSWRPVRAAIVHAAQHLRTRMQQQISSHSRGQGTKQTLNVDSERLRPPSAASCSPRRRSTINRSSDVVGFIHLILAVLFTLCMKRVPTPSKASSSNPDLLHRLNLQSPSGWSVCEAASWILRDCACLVP